MANYRSVQYKMCTVVVVTVDSWIYNYLCNQCLSPLFM